AEWVHDSPALVLALARPELREIRPALAETGRSVAETISLEGLSARATEELAARLVGAESLPHDLLARLPDSTEGNPLFVRELMKMLVDDGVIVESDGRWELTIDAEAVEVPPTIHGLLSARLERMPVDERRLVELASVVGPEFPLGAVAAISTSSDVGGLLPTLERLRRNELVEPTGTYWGNEPLFRFHHVLIRDAAYRRLLKGARADLHIEVGTWIEATAANLVGEHEVTIAHHFEQAHDYRQQLNITDDSTTAIGRRASDLLRAAAIRALDRDDVAAAGSLAVRAVARLQSDADELPDLLMLGCEALLASGDVGSARPLLKQLADRSVGDERLAAWTACFDAQLVVLTDPDRLEVAESAAESAADELASLGDQAGEAKARLVLAGALARLGRIGDCERQLDMALNAARASEDGRRIAAVLGAAPVAALWGPSPVSRAGGRCLDVIRLLRITTGSPGVEATATRCQAVLEAFRGRFDTARTMLAEARATVEELGLRHGLLETELYSGIVELLANDPVAAEPFLRSAYGGLGRLGIGADAGQAAAHLSRALLLQGRLDEADELAADSEALAGQNPQTSIAALTARAEILAARGDLAAALRLAEAAVALGADTDIVIDHGQANVALARVRLAAGDMGGTLQARRAAEALFEQKGATIDLGELALLRPPVEADAPSSELPPPDKKAADPLSAGTVADDAAVAESFFQGESAAARPIGASRAFERFATSTYALFARAGTDRDVTVLMAIMDHRLTMVDHRQLGWPVVDYDGFRSRMDSVSEISGDVAITVPHIHRIDGLLSLVEMVTVITRPNGAEHTDRSLIINDTSTESGLMLWTEQFHGHDEAAATARFEEMVVEAGERRELWNVTSIAVNRLCTWQLRGRSDLMETLLADDVLIEHHHGARRSFDPDDFEVSQRRVLAVRGDHLALIEFRPADPSVGRATTPGHRFVVAQLDADSLISRMSCFDFDRESLRAAADLLDELWLNSGDIDATRHSGVPFEMLDAFRHRDVERFAELLSDDIRVLDRRPLGWEDYDKAGWLDLMGRLSELAGAAVASRILRVEEFGAVVQMSEWAFGEGAELDEMLPGIYVAISDGEHVTHIEGHSDQDPDTALARFDELVAEQRAPSRRRADDLVVDDRRSTTDVEPVGADRSTVAVSANRSFLDPAAVLETIAERGDRLALSRATVGHRDGARGRELDCLVVERRNALG
ncbi:ATP-binding protein, partial [Ilumatobacter sp.]|uniref:ATP-binding protein n=1 Tax=Ilumatobacter sp. TaxID=1967498 RepID=UPI003C68FAD7